MDLLYSDNQGRKVTSFPFKSLSFKEDNKTCTNQWNNRINGKNCLYLILIHLLLLIYLCINALHFLDFRRWIFILQWHLQISLVKSRTTFTHVKSNHIKRGGWTSLVTCTSSPPFNTAISQKVEVLSKNVKENEPKAPTLSNKATYWSHQ